MTDRRGFLITAFIASAANLPQPKLTALDLAELKEALPDQRGFINCLHQGKLIYGLGIPIVLRWDNDIYKLTMEPFFFPNQPCIVDGFVITDEKGITIAQGSTDRSYNIRHGDMLTLNVALSVQLT